MKNILITIFMLTCSCLFALSLVKDGKATGEFVIGDSPHKAIVWSVTDIRYWIHEITGVNVPILAQPSGNNNTKVFVGKSYALQCKQDLASLKDSDGYAIRSEGNNVYIFGNRPRGTLYGVFALLEKNSDIIWARPNRRIGTIFGKSSDLILTKTNMLVKPVFNIRYQGGHFRPYHKDTLDWQMRNLANVTVLSGPYTNMDMVIRLHDIPYWRLSRTLKKKDYLKKHPEIFAYSHVYKKRVGVGICYMNPQTVDIYFKELMNYLNEKEKALGQKVDYINLHMGDSWTVCECPLCIKPIRLADGTYQKMKSMDPYKDMDFRSTQYYIFYSKLTEKLQQVRPDIKLLTLAYIYSVPAPKIKPHPKLNIGFCAYPTCNTHFSILDKRQNEYWRKHFSNWMKITKRLGMRGYYNPNTIAPNYLSCQQDLLTYMTKQDKNSLIITTETYDDITLGEPGWDLATMAMWINNRLFWDPTLDIDELRRHFINRTYREAAPAMTRYYDIIRESWLEPQDKTFCGWHGSQQYIYQNLIVKKKLEKPLLKALNDALKTVKNPKSKEMIQRIYNRLTTFNNNLGKLVICNVPDMANDGTKFHSLAWDLTKKLDRFLVCSRYKKNNLPSLETSIRAAHDGENMYLKFHMEDYDPKTIDAPAKSSSEVFPKGDHVEIWFYNGANDYVIAFNSNGRIYDAKNLNKEWKSYCKLYTRKTDKGWDAIITMPLRLLKLKPGTKTSVRWTAFREIKHKNQAAENVVYNGMVLNYKTYPIEME